MNKLSTYSLVKLYLSVAMAVFTGCATLDGPVAGGSGGGPLLPRNLLSTEDEIALGGQISAEVEKQERVLGDPALQQYVREIGARIARNAPRQDVPYTFTVIDNPTTVNAFALPGGHMYIYTGLLKLCENEAELASVMGHEISHVAAYHHGESMTRQYRIDLVTGVLLGSNRNGAVQMAADFAKAAGSARYSKNQEREADTMGLDLLFRAGYKPEAMMLFMEKMMAQEQQQGGRGMMLFSSHPATSERVNNLRAMIAQYPLDLRINAQLNSERYASEVLKRLN